MITALSFFQALRHPSDQLLKALGGVCPEFGNGRKLPDLQRLTEFLEATVTCGTCRYRIAAPLNDQASRMAVRRAAALNRLDTSRISRFRLAEKALVRFDTLGEICTEHLFVERIPEGRPLDEIFPEGYPASRMHGELTALQEEFRRIGFSHGNLKPENLHLTPEGRLMAVRCYRAGFDGPTEDDERAFKALHRLADRQDNSQLLEEVEQGPAKPVESGGYRIRYSSEETFTIEKNGRYGFIDSDGRKIVKPVFDKVKPFREGRAIVCRNKKYGVIDKKANSSSL